MDADLIVTKLTLDEVFSAVLTLPYARRVSDGILFEGERGVRGYQRADDVTFVAVYDREDHDLVDQVYEALLSQHPDASLIQYDEADEILRANHPEVLVA